MESPAEPVYEVVWPRSPQGVQRTQLAPRLPDLNGATIALLWDYLFRGDENPLRDIALLFENNLGEDGLEELPDELAYLRGD